MQKDIYDEVMQNHNPLMQIHIGTPDEVWEVRKLAREIVSSVNFPPEIKEHAIEIIATVTLHCIYAHYADPQNYPLQATIESVINFLKPKLTTETLAYDKDGVQYIVPRVCTYPESFKDRLWELCKFNHVTNEGIEIPIITNGQYNTRLLDCEMIHEIYYADTDIYQINPHAHPWICRNFLFFSRCKTPSFKEAISLTPLILERYLDNHPQYTNAAIMKTVYEKSKQTYKTPEKRKKTFLFSTK